MTLRIPRWLLFGLGGAIVAGGIVVGAILLTGGGDDDPGCISKTTGDPIPCEQTLVAVPADEYSPDGASTTTAPTAEEVAADEEAVRSVADQFTAAIGTGDAETLCGDIAAPPVGGSICESIWSGSPSSFMRSFLAADVERVVIDSPKATVAFDNNQIVEFKKIGDSWHASDWGGPENTAG